MGSTREASRSEFSLLKTIWKTSSTVQRGHLKVKDGGLRLTTHGNVWQHARNSQRLYNLATQRAINLHCPYTRMELVMVCSITLRSAVMRKALRRSISR